MVHRHDAIQVLSLLLELTGVVAMLPSRAEGSACAPVDAEQHLFACPTEAARDAAIRLTARPLAAEASLVPPLEVYRDVVMHIAKGAKLTPLLFPGPPMPAQGDAPDAPGRAGQRAKKGKKTGGNKGIVLQGGYLYSTDARTARRWHRTLQLHELFESPEVVIRRGDEHLTATRQRYGYVYADGPWAGQRARILLFDQVAPSRDALPPPAAFDLASMRRALGVRTFDVTSLTPTRAELVAHFANGDVLPVVAVHTGQRTLLFTGPADAARVRQSMTQSRADTDVEHAILDAAATMARENLRFDEPKTEFGQQDGLLRREWGKAYRAGRREFVVNGDRYPVFDEAGRPYVPQVCIDFIIDAIDRSGGSWFRPQGQPPGRPPGRLDLYRLDRYDERSVRDTVRIARERPEMWDIYTVPKGEEVPFRLHDAFVDKLNHFPVSLREADFLVIWGLRSDGRNHFHSYFVYQTDPIFGVPVAFSDNAGHAAIRVVDDIMRVAPRRYVLHRLRLLPAWVRARREEFEREAPASPLHVPGDDMGESLPPPGE